MRMQLRVERAAARVRERGGGKIAGHTVTIFNAMLADASRGESFEFAEREPGRFLMRFNQSLVVQRDRQHRNRFRRGTSEIVKHPTLAFLLAPLRQSFAIVWILIFAERMKLVARDILL